ncbi:MAG: TolC family protein, partial [Bacteroidales bacterium]|nr:TolC family protein [Bacteroidales bacterium]
MKHHFISALILSTILQINNIAAQNSYTLEQLCDSAISHNAQMSSARYNVEAARQQRKEAFTKYFPSVSAVGVWFNANKAMAETQINASEYIPQELGATLQQSFPPEALAALGNPITIAMMKDGVIGAVTAVQPIFTGGQIYNGNRLAKVGEDVSQLQLKLSENEIIKTTSEYFWQTVSLQEKLKTVNAVDSLLQV